MVLRAAVVVLAALWAVGCGDDEGPGVLDGGRDGAAPDGSPAARDGGPGAEDAGASGDAGDGTDGAAPDGGAAPDAGGPPEGCDPVRGVECDGDWAGRCRASCAPTQCCSPVGGRFECVARDAEESCPRADIWVDEGRVTASAAVDWRQFEPGDCAIVEGCVDAPGWRRLFRFATWTPNTGDADLYLGPPEDMPDLFEYSACHEHHHFDSYARYELRATDGTVVARGHKQAFCLLDYYRYPGTDPRGARYTCTDQGIQAGYQDVYGENLDCQWVDVTDVPPGDYVLRIELNYEHVLAESDYGNNVAEVPVTIPPEPPVGDITVPCPAGTPRGTERACGFTRGAPHSCTPGATVRVGCSTRCGLGSCTGDPFLRVCDTADDPACGIREALGSNDDSGCGGGSCGRGGDCCPRTDFTCPPSGSYVVFWAPYDPTATASCTLAIE